MPRKLYVGNLPLTATDEDLQTLFSKAGAVESVTIVKSQDTGNSKGFAFVEMADESAAQSAIEAFNMKPLAGRFLNVNAVRSVEWEKS